MPTNDRRIANAMHKHRLAAFRRRNMFPLPKQEKEEPVPEKKQKDKEE